MPAPLHGKGWLQETIWNLIQQFDAGKVSLPEGKTLTPTAIAKIIGEKKKIGGKSIDPPSVGAVSACLDRLTDYGLISNHDKPRAVKGLTALGKKKTPDEVVAERRAAKSAASAAARAAKKPAKKAPAKKAAAKKAPAKKGAAKKGAAKKAVAKKATATKPA